MNRNDFDITNKDEILSVLNSCKACRVGFYDKVNDEVYIVPMNFGFEYDDKIILYFHGSPKGRKYELIKAGARVGIELDCDSDLNMGNNACSYSYKYKSAIGNGYISEIKDNCEKEKALNLIMEHYTNKTNWDYSPKYFNYVAVYKLEVSNISFREHK